MTLVGLGAIALLVVALQKERRDSPDRSTNAPAEDGQARASSPTSRASSVRVPGSTAQLPPAARTWPEPSPEARQLVNSLGEVRPGEITPEGAAIWQRNLRELLDQGTGAISALEEFLQRNEDVKFDSDLLGEPSLRIALLRLLSDLPGPGNLELQEQVLRTSGDPDEIALLANQLELQAPGKYRAAIIEAAQAAVENASNGKLAGRDAAPLVRLLEKYGEAASK